ncbi:hypothetical protein PAMA_004063 [Pampus argenteus]
MSQQLLSLSSIGLNGQSLPVHNGSSVHAANMRWKTEFCESDNQRRLTSSSSSSSSSSQVKLQHCVTKTTASKQLCGYWPEHSHTSDTMVSEASPTVVKKREKFQLNYFLRRYIKAEEAHICASHRRAERVTSLGKDWHRPCLKCEKCNKTLSPGSHAEHEGKPYCHNPCYGAMFGPKGFGRGGTESHAYK